MREVEARERLSRCSADGREKSRVARSQDAMNLRRKDSWDGGCRDVRCVSISAVVRVNGSGMCMYTDAGTLVSS